MQKEFWNNYSTKTSQHCVFVGVGGWGRGRGHS